AVEPGGWGLAQLFLEEPVVAVWGQPFVVRESSATFTIGGGQVLQPVAKKIRRRHVEVLERVEQLWGDDEARRALAVAWFAGTGGVTAAALVRGAGVSPARAEELLARLRADQRLVEVMVGQSRKLTLHGELLGELEERLMQALARLHAESPLMTGHERQKGGAQLYYLG